MDLFYTLMEKLQEKQQGAEELNQVFERLDKFRLSKDLSDRAMSIAIHMDPSTINKIRRNNITMSWNFFKNLSTYFPELNIQWVLGGAGEMLVSDNNLSEESDERMPAMLLEIIKMQATSLKEKDDQISKLIGLLSNNQNG